MAQSSEGVSEAVESVRFSFMTDEEVRSHSVVKITNTILLDTVERPVPGGLYDPAMGPIDEQTACKSCGQRAFHCPGHCGHIDLVSPVYNPLLFNLLHHLLQRTCYSCLHFRASRSEVEKSVAQLELISKGDIVGAKMLDSIPSDESPDLEDSDGSHITCSTVHDGAQNHSSEHSNKQHLNSLQFTEAINVLNKFFKQKPVKCSNCEAKNPKITKPTFGWFHTKGMSSAQNKANIIRGCKIKGPYTGGVDEKSSSEVVDANDSTWEDGLDASETSLSAIASAGNEDSMTKRRGNKGVGVPKEFLGQKDSFSGHFLPSDVRETVKLLWENEARLCSFICDLLPDQIKTVGNNTGYLMFFLEAILVPPIKFRPATKGDTSVMEHPQTVLLSKVLQSNISLGNVHVNNSEGSKVVARWMELQQSINILFDSKTASGQKDAQVGICQLLEKKEGIFRQKMMGKRVNFACRSVISPDPYLAVNEIGIPPYFAIRLTYPEKVTPWNVVKLREAVINGSEIHPGATHYVDKLSTVKLPPSRKSRISISRKLPSSRGVVTQLGKSGNYDFESKAVYRHLRDGDVVLVNRQPTLHKPSIMAHVVRVLKGEKTLRMHYANCSYNADFDGDEMNVHLPQDEISRAEAYNIVNANNQYIVPTRGDTVRGLIQDHIVSAVLLTMKNTFLTFEEYNQLLYSCGVFAAGKGSFSGNDCHKISRVHSEVVMQPVLPTVWKPKPLWTGKQVITALLNHITRGCMPFTVEHEAKIPHQYFASRTSETQANKDEEESGEHNLLIRRNELVRGVIDKAQFGKYGLVHTVQELYGSDTAGILLSALSRLFTTFLQIHGFTCGVDDLMILPHYDRQRKETLEGQDIGERVHRDFVNDKSKELDFSKLQLEIEKAIRSNGQSAVASLDTNMRSELNKKGSAANKDLLLKGLLKPFPKNCIAIMTITGAKGSTVNFQQISSFLGQQELEGKRVPRMVSGKTLPCFVPWDFTSRAGGFISDRFLTGLRPQEYYFHCMAGREGLVDTAVKTSRSGYLQRCLVKNLECLKVCYDYTVRDADGSIIQFRYGEDGVDVHQTSFLTNFEALATNQEIICQKLHQQYEFNSFIKKLPKRLKVGALAFLDKLSGKGEKERVENDFLKLMKQKYLSSLAQSGEPVGVIAAQSVGEPSTQMTLNTFHLAGRGEMNVTLGIPRLQEILMTASNNIKTPIMTCPLLEGRNGKILANKLKKVTVADIIESIEVSLLPLSAHDHQICRIYKLIMKLSKPGLISIEDCEETLECVFLRELEDAIQSHLFLLSKISGIKHFTETRSKASVETDDEPGSKPQENGDEDEDEGDGDERADDLGSDALKRKQQSTDEMDYDDDIADEPNEEETSTETEKETDRRADGAEVTEDDEISTRDVEDEASEMPDEHDEVLSKPKSSKEKPKKKAEIKKKKKKAKISKKDSDRAIFVKAEGLHFEAHFKFTNEPHLLLAQIVQKTAQKVPIKSSGKMGQCEVVEYNQNEQVIWNEAMKPGTGDSGPCALRTAGIDFHAFWNMQDELDTRRVYSNNIHAMLNTYGVEAARGTIIREIKHVFSLYGVQIDFRHLSLIAEYMTFSGGYRSMSRHGGIAESVSPFLKMSFETAAKFIVEAAYHGMTDNLETPSSRICLGLPVKVGTGCFDLMQKLEV